MLDINFIRENQHLVKKGIGNKGYDPALVDKVLELDETRRKLLLEVDQLRAKKNRIAEEKKPSEEGRKIKEELKDKEPELSDVEKEYKELLYKIPNIASGDTPIGKDESENKVIKKWGEPRNFDFKPRDHVEIGKILNIINTEAASKVSGARFNYLRGDAVLLENALYQFALSILLNVEKLAEIANKVEKNYCPKPFVPILPPLLINPDVYKKMGRLSPETEIERYAIPRDNQYLIGSAEHTLGPLHMGQTIDEEQLPLRYFALTPAFRREAGSYGKDTKGIIRQHQFDKLEMESFVSAENGLKEQNFLIAIIEYFMQNLEIPYEVISVCTGDMGGPDFRQIDINSWMPGQDRYRETHTSDYMTDYQSRRLGTRVQMKNGKIEFVHMNDATGFAMGRMIVAVLENFQEKDGSVRIPKVLQKWMGKEKIVVNK